MLAGNIKLAKKYDYLEPKLVKGYEWLQQNDPSKLENGRYDICEGVFALVQRYNTKPLSEARFEAHDKFFDIQYICEGIEAFGVCSREGLEVTEDQLEKSDVVFFKTPAVYTDVNLQPGEFVVVPPEDAHQPGVAYGGKSVPVVKVVVKVAV